jgi:putative heme-binding domain-containing protein
MLEERDGAIYKLIPADWFKPVAYEPERNVDAPASESSIALGQQMFTDRACNACHAIDGKTELLGPNLKDIANTYNREELLEEIMEPARRIKPSMAPTRLTLANGDILLGRVVNADDDKVNILVTGNNIVEIKRAEIVDEEIVMQSMMYEGLLNGTTDEEKNALLDYLLSLADKNG